MTDEVALHVAPPDPDNIGSNPSTAGCATSFGTKACFGLDHARSAIAEWREDFNTARPHSSLGSQTPAAFAEVIAATGSTLRRLLNPRQTA